MDPVLTVRESLQYKTTVFVNKSMGTNNKLRKHSAALKPPIDRLELVLSKISNI